MVNTQHIYICNVGLKKTYLFGCPGSLLWHKKSLVVALGIKFPDQGLNLGPLHWDFLI